MGDPYIRAWLRQRRNRARAEGFGGILRDALVPALGVALLVPVVRPVFFEFLTLDRDLWPLGAREITLRASMVAIGWMGVDLFGALVRSPSRDTLAALPIEPGRLVRAELVRIAVGRLWWLPAIALLLSPLALAGAPDLWARATVAVMSNAVLGLAGGANATLAAIAVARDPRWAPFLDLVRGNNPRESAAFLYAPASVLLGAGGLLWVSCEAVAGSGPLAALGLVAPALVGLALLWPIPRLARRTWFQATGVIAEIDGRYARLADPEEARSVYLDWAVRWFPRAWRRDLLDDLRHGWRTRRTLVSAAWLFALAAAGGAWTEVGSAPARATTAVVAGALAVCANALWLAADEPAVLRVLLPRDPTARRAARASALALWCAPTLAVGALATWAGLGGPAALRVAAACVAAWAAGAAAAVGLERLGRRGLGVYGAWAALVGAALVWVNS